MDQKEIGVLDRTDMDHFADIFVSLQARGKSQDKNREHIFEFAGRIQSSFSRNRVAGCEARSMDTTRFTG
jgi:hypothetical protein